MKSTSLSNGATFTPSECWFDHSRLVRIECGHLTTRSAKASVPSFKLPIVVFRHSWWQNSKSPMLHLAGGPGGSSYIDNKFISYQIQNFIDQDWQIDFVLYDQRGTGLSQPSLQCDKSVQQTLDILAKPMSAREESLEFIATTQECLHDLNNDTAYSQHLKYISTSNSVNDISDLHDLLKVDQWVLMGTSYGTRLALEAARQAPIKVKSMILDSVYPAEFDGFETLTENNFDWLEVLLTFCRRDESCNERFPSLRNDFTKALSALKESPLTVVVPAKDDKPTRQMVITVDRFLNFLSYAGYDSSLLELVPTAISAVVKGESDDDALIALAKNLLEVVASEDFSEPVYMVTECLENGGFDYKGLQKTLQTNQAKYPMLDLSLDSIYDPSMCDGWRKLPTAERRNFREPVKSQIPSLVLAGGLDAVTPASWGRSAVRGLSNSIYLEYPDAGHAVLYSSLCSNDEVQLFLNPEQKETAFCDKEERRHERSNASFEWFD